MYGLMRTESWEALFVICVGVDGIVWVVLTF